MIPAEVNNRSGRYIARSEFAERLCPVPTQTGIPPATKAAD